MPDPGPWLTIPEIVHAAERRLPRHLWDYACGGAESEVTVRRNRAEFERLSFRSRVLRDVRRRDTSTTFLGFPLDLPVMLAPVGSVAHFDPDGALACARAAERERTAAFIGSLSSPELEAVRAGSGAPLLFQIYVKGDRDWTADLISRARRAGFQGLCVTADSAVYGRRERDLHNRFFPRGALSRPNLPGAGADLDAEGQGPNEYQAGLTWDDIDWMRSVTSLPIVIKGVMCAEDADMAVEHGASAIYVSNHGGRQLDHNAATISVLPEIVDAVRGRAEVVVDSGFLRGTDVLKAMAMGARAVLIGKLMLWALAAGGDQGLSRVLQLLRTEISVAMASLGVTTLADLSPACLRLAQPPMANPWPYNALAQ